MLHGHIQLPSQAHVHFSQPFVNLPSASRHAKTPPFFPKDDASHKVIGYFIFSTFPPLLFIDAAKFSVYNKTINTLLFYDKGR